MKNKKIFIGLVVSILLFGIVNMVSADLVIEDTNVVLEQANDPWGYGSDYSISVNNWYVWDALLIDQVNNGDGTYTLTPTLYTVADAMDFYSAPYAAEFSYETISSGQYELFFSNLTEGPYATQGSLTISNMETFYLGISLGFPEDDPNRDAFGWAQFSMFFGNLQMMDNAMAYETEGIYIGTSTTVSAVPILGAAWLFVSGGILGLVGLRKKKKF